MGGDKQYIYKKLVDGGAGMYEIPMLLDLYNYCEGKYAKKE